MGCGGMEVERQVIQVLQAKQHPGCVLFVGIDQSPVAHAIAKENLHTLGSAIVIEEYERLDREYLKSAVMSSQQTYSVILAKNDVFKLHEEFHGCLFDIAFSSLFKHHLPPARKDEFDQTLAAVAKRVLEYDGYKSWGVMIPQTLTTWKSPVLLNGTIFSDLRYHTKKELKKKAGGHKISFTKIGTYLMEK
jgi:SAM-dependent methyltransferase